MHGGIIDNIMKIDLIDRLYKFDDIKYGIKYKYFLIYFNRF